MSPCRNRPADEAPAGAAAPTTLDALLDALADRIVERLESRRAAPRYADVESSPFKTGRAFLDAARREEFPTFIRSRRVTALWIDCEQAIEGRKRAKPARTAAPTEAEIGRADLEQMGAKMPPAKTTTKKAV